MSINWDVFMSSGLATALVGGIGYLLKRWFKKKDEQTLTKKQLGDEIIKIVTEGEDSNYQKEPRNTEHLQYIKNQLGCWDKETENLFNLFVLEWKFRGIAEKYGNPSGKAKHQEMILERLKGESKLLLTTAHKWIR